MPESREHHALVDAAGRAAAAGDHASAERLLRDAAIRQEAELGPLDPDLANTLNNLGVVCEITRKDEDAERCYRRAYAIAVAALDPDHPFVATSRKNLRDFCAARGRPMDVPAAPAATGAAPHVAAVLRALIADPLARRLGSGWLSRPYTIVTLSLSGVVLVLLVTIPIGVSSNGQRQAAAVVEAAAPPAPAIEPPSAPPAPAASAKPAASRPAPKPPPRRPAGRSTATPAIASAQLCRSLALVESRTAPGDWRCDPARRPADAGALFFYTRVRSPRDTTVEHRWYRGSELYQSVDLRVRANQGNGFRTYSRFTMTGRSAGDWRVELRSRDGALLHEERFVVR